MICKKNQPVQQLMSFINHVRVFQKKSLLICHALSYLAVQAFVVIFLLFCNTSISYSQSVKGVSIETGYAHVMGYYSSRLEGAPAFGLRIVPYEWDYLFADGAFSFSAFPLSKSSESNLYVAGLDAGINTLYRYKIVTPFAGVAAGARYLRFDGKKTGVTLQTLKPSGGVRIGLSVKIAEHFNIVARTDYSINQLSGKLFSEITHSVGITYRFTEQGANIAKVDNYIEGVADMNAGNLESARAHFMAVNKEDLAYSDARKYIDDINNLFSVYNEARKLLSENRKLEAIPLLDNVSSRIKEAVAIVDEIRKELRKDIPALVENGIAAYNSQDYQLCIIMMRKVLIIDPSNKTARVYLSRAEKRNEALQKLQ